MDLLEFLHDRGLSLPEYFALAQNSEVLTRNERLNADEARELDSELGFIFFGQCLVRGCQPNTNIAEANDRWQFGCNGVYRRFDSFGDGYRALMQISVSN